MIAQNKADVDSGERTKLILAITTHITDKYGCNAESMAIQDPQDLARSIRITRDRLYIWARAMMHKAPGVDLDHPPQTL